MKHIEQKDTHCEHCGQKMADGGEVKGPGKSVQSLVKDAESGMSEEKKKSSLQGVERHQSMGASPAKQQQEPLVVAIMNGRKKMAKGGEVEEKFEEEGPDSEAWMEDKEDFSAAHYIEDEEHEVESDPSKDDKSVVGQIMKDRKKKKQP